jgi:hypothetical protein
MRLYLLCLALSLPAGLPDEGGRAVKELNDRAGLRSNTLG